MEIPNSVKSIGISPFCGCSSLESFSGKFATEDQRCLNVDGVLKTFAPAGLNSYVIPNSVTTVGEKAFYYCTSLSSVEIPNSVTTIINGAFNGSSGLKEIKSLNPVPPTIYSGSFNYVDKKACKLMVPEEAVDDYKAADYWKEFFNIEGFGTSTGIEGVATESINKACKSFNLRGAEVGKGYKGIVIQNGTKILKK